MKVRIGIDVGGNVTDAVAINNDTYELIGTVKVPTTHTAKEGVAAGIVEVLHKVMEYIYRKSLEIYETGISVILEGGFWQRELREEASSFYAAHGITPQWHYVDVSEEAWKRNIEMRNQQALKGEPDVSLRATSEEHFSMGQNR